MGSFQDKAIPAWLVCTPTQRRGDQDRRLQEQWHQPSEAPSGREGGLPIKSRTDGSLMSPPRDFSEKAGIFRYKESSRSSSATRIKPCPFCSCLSKSRRHSNGDHYDFAMSEVPVSGRPSSLLVLFYIFSFFNPKR